MRQLLDPEHAGRTSTSDPALHSVENRVPMLCRM
jgi:hypothetical protein